MTYDVNVTKTGNQRAPRRADTSKENKEYTINKLDVHRFAKNSDRRTDQKGSTKNQQQISSLEGLFRAANIEPIDLKDLNASELAKHIRTEFVKNITESSIILTNETFSFGDASTLRIPVTIEVSLLFDKISLWIDDYLSDTNTEHRINKDFVEIRDVGHTLGEYSSEDALFMDNFFDALSKYVLSGIQTGELLYVKNNNVTYMFNSLKYQLYEQHKYQCSMAQLKYRENGSENKFKPNELYKLIPYIDLDVSRCFDSSDFVSIRERLNSTIFGSNRFENDFGSLLALSGDGEHIRCFKKKANCKDDRHGMRSKRKSSTKTVVSNQFEKFDEESTRNTHFNETDNIVDDVHDFDYDEPLNIYFLLDRCELTSVSSNSDFNVSVTFKNIAQSLSSKHLKNNLNMIEHVMRIESSNDDSVANGQRMFEEQISSFDDYLREELDFFSNIDRHSYESELLTSEMSKTSERDKSERRCLIDPKSLENMCGQFGNPMFEHYVNYFEENRYQGRVLNPKINKNVGIADYTANISHMLSKTNKKSAITSDEVLTFYESQNAKTSSDLVVVVRGVNSLLFDYDATGRVSDANEDDAKNTTLAYFVKSKKIANAKPFDSITGDHYINKRKRLSKMAQFKFNRDFEEIPRIMYIDSAQNSICNGRYLVNLSMSAIDNFDKQQGATLSTEKSTIRTVEDRMSALSEKTVTAILANYKLFFETDVVPHLYRTNVFDTKDVDLNRAKYMQIGYIQYGRSSNDINLVIQSCKPTESQMGANDDSASTIETKIVVAIHNDICDMILTRIESKKYEDLQFLNYEDARINVAFKYNRGSLAPLFKNEMVRQILKQTYAPQTVCDIVVSPNSSRGSKIGDPIDADVHSESTEENGPDGVPSKNRRFVSELNDGASDTESTTTLEDCLFKSLLESEHYAHKCRLKIASETALSKLFSSIKIETHMLFRGWMYNNFKNEM